MKVKWSIQRDGAGVIHSAELLGYKILITNWPNTRSIWVEIKNKVGATLSSEFLDKAEHRVWSVKEMAINEIRERGQGPITLGERV